MGFASTCFTCVLNTFNTLWAIGSVSFIAGAVLNFGQAPIFLVCVLFLIGVLGLTASLLGCCGTCSENIKVTKAYAIVIGISLVIQIISLIVLSTTNAPQSYAEKEINERWEKEVKKEPEGMDLVQHEFKCCGKDGPSDYITILHREYPASCYPNQFGNQSALYNDGCIEKASIYFKDIIKDLLGVSWGSIVFTVIMLLLAAIYLIIHFRKKQSSQRYNYNECPVK